MRCLRPSMDGGRDVPGHERRQSLSCRRACSIWRDLSEPGLPAFDRDDLVRSGNIPADRVKSFAVIEVDRPAISRASSRSRRRIVRLKAEHESRSEDAASRRSRSSGGPSGGFRLQDGRITCSSA